MRKNIRNAALLTLTGSAALQAFIPVGALADGLMQHRSLQTTPSTSQTFEKDGFIYKVLTGSRVEVMAVRNSDFRELVIPYEVEVHGRKYTPVKVGSMVFMGMPELERVYLPSSMEDIAESAFISCPKLEEVYFAENAKKAVLIKKGAFENCPRLTTLVLPDMEVSLEEGVFTGTDAIRLYRYSLDTGADLGSYRDLFMGLYENRAVTVTQDITEENTDSLPIFSTEVTDLYGEAGAAGPYVQIQATGWMLTQGRKQYLQEDGQLARNTWRTIDQRQYYFQDDGTPATGWQKLDSRWYLFDENGRLLQNTWTDDWYLGADGIRQPITWVRTSQGWKLLSQDGTCRVDGWQNVEGSRYYFDSQGLMKTGWIHLDSGWYFLYSSGAMARDTYIGDYYVNKEGLWQSDLDKPRWIKVGNRWWYRHSGGTCTRGGWEVINGKEYYFDDEGWMKTGWIAVNGKWYYCYSSGEKARDTWIGDYYVDADGIWSEDRWVTTSNGRMYRYADGSYARNGWKTINKKQFYFDPDGYLVTGWNYIDGQLYFLNNEGTGGSVSDTSQYVWDGNGWQYNAHEGLHGVDISHWQSGIDVTLIPADFIIAKASGGNGFLDKSFTSYAKAAHNSGKLFGMYHFARDHGYEGSAKEEAEFFYSVVKDYIGWGIPILDWESDLHLGPEWVEEFLDRFYELSGVRCVLYTSASVTRAYNWSKVARKGHSLWLAQYAGNNHVIGYEEDPWRDSWGNGAFREVLMHQYTSKGKLPGYNGNLDLDIFYGSREDWNQLASKNQK